MVVGVQFNLVNILSAVLEATLVVVAFHNFPNKVCHLRAAWSRAI